MPYRDPEQKRARQRADRAANRERVDAIKLARGCADCGYSEHPRALQFDHPPGAVKDDPYGGRRAFHQSWPWARIEAAIAECEVVCANCHAIRTSERRRS